MTDACHIVRGVQEFHENIRKVTNVKQFKSIAKGESQFFTHTEVEGKRQTYSSYMIEICIISGDNLTVLLSQDDLPQLNKSQYNATLRFGDACLQIDISISNGLFCIYIDD